MRLKKGAQTINVEKKKKPPGQMVLLLAKHKLLKGADYETVRGNLHLSAMPSHCKYKTTRSKYCFMEEFY